LRDGRFELAISEPIIRDVAGVLTRPRIARKYRVPAEHIDEMVMLLREHGDLVPVTGTMRICRDPDDDLVLETALNGEAQALVSRDADVTRDPALIAALRERGVAVLTVQQFLDELGDEEAQADT
jgi:putative PIN family toxin of toxin-antitoxin system